MVHCLYKPNNEALPCAPVVTPEHENVLWSLYQHTVFRGSQCFRPVADFAIITAWNPRGTCCNAVQNNYYDTRLQLDITAYVSRSLYGCSPDLCYWEKSWAVFCSVEQATVLSLNHQQNAFYWVDKQKLWLMPALLNQQRPQCLGRFSERYEFNDYT